MNEMKFPYLVQEENYKITMNQIVEPFLCSVQKSGYFERQEKEAIYYEFFEAINPIGIVVISHGYTESIYKHLENIYYFLMMGYNVWILEHRGHGRSYRDISDISLTNVKDYRDYERDLSYFIEMIVERKEELPLILYAHSMGGAIGTLYLENHPDQVSKAILTSPMLEINYGSKNEKVMYFLSYLMIALGKGNQYIKGDHPFDGKNRQRTSSAQSKVRYEYQLELKKSIQEIQNSGGTYRWGHQAMKMYRKATSKHMVKKICTPILFFNAKEDNLVTQKGHERFISRLKTEYHYEMVENTRHEIFNANDDVISWYWNRIEKFLKGEETN